MASNAPSTPTLADTINANKMASNVVTPPPVSETSESQVDLFHKMDYLCDFMGLARQSDASKSLLDFLVFMGSESLDDLACIEKQDFDDYQKPLSRTIQRKLLLIAEFLATGGNLREFKTISDLRAKSNQDKCNDATASTATVELQEPTSHSEPTIDDAVIHLDVGGHKFTTTKDTLCSVSGSVLEAMFSGRHACPSRRDKDGSYVIDRNGTHFHYILDFLRVGAVISLPREADAKEELVVEADYYGLQDLVRAIRVPQVDTSLHLSKDVLAMRQEENTLRNAFMDGTAKTYSPYRGLIKLFCPDQGIQPLPVRYEPQDYGNDLLMGNLRENPSPGTPVTATSLDEFVSNLNREHPNLLNRISNILAEEPVVIAGGSVLRALTSSSGTRTADWWGDKSDVDLFVHANSPEEATRISRRIFNAVATRHERWAIVRSRGVITMHNWVGERWHFKVDLKVQIVLRLYDSPAEVLLGFDCDSCCCLYDGRSVWLTPRCLRALRTGVNILNPLHSVPNKCSYELRLGKYAFRGFSALAPGLERSRIDYDKIRSTSLRELKGMARLLKVSFEMDAAPNERVIHWNHGGVVEASFPRPPLQIMGLYSHAREDVNDADFTTRGMGSSYEDGFERSGVLVPQVYGIESERGDYMWWFGNVGDFPRAEDTVKQSAWDDIADARSVLDAPEGVPVFLTDAWDTEKRSREYLNSEMDAFDRDNIYYGHAYKKLDDL